MLVHYFGYFITLALAFLLLLILCHFENVLGNVKLDLGNGQCVFLSSIKLNTEYSYGIHDTRQIALYICVAFASLCSFFCIFYVFVSL